jgi:hypothetical protein
MRKFALLATVLGLIAGAPAFAGPLAEVGDRQLRQDVDLLAAAGLIQGPVDSWPLAWAQIDAGLNRAHDGRELDPYLKSAVARLDRLADFAAQRVSLDVRLGATNNVSVARDFGTLARGQFDGSGRVEFNSSVVSVAIGAGLRSGAGNPDSNYVHFEPSQVVIRLDNWALYGGFTEEWFGPGHDGALLWSNSTRPMPKIGLKRLNPNPVDFPVLRWLGPLQFEIFGGVLNEDRDYRNTIVVGTRLSFTPARGLQIGLNRSQMLCGEGRPCGFKQLELSFIGVGNSDNPKPGDPLAFYAQAGNQLAGWDISYTHRFGPVAAKFYVEAEAEDFDNIILEQYSRMIGTTLSGPWGKRGASWTATIEYADTQAASLFNGTPLESVTGGETTYPYSMYNHSLYTSGYTYRGRPIGYWTDGDSHNLSFSGAVTDTHNRRWYGSVRSVNINFNNLGNPPLAVFPRPDGTPGPAISYRVSANNEKFALLTAGAEVPTAFGDVRIEARYQTDSPNTPGAHDGKAAIEVQFRQRF